MRIFHGFENLPSFVSPVVTVGSFDGVHRGHQALLKQLLTESRNNGGESIVLTFEPHPRVTLGRAEGLRLLTSFDEKCALLEQAEGDPLKKAELINDIADTVAMIPDPVKRSVYADTCSGKFNISADILFSRIRRTREDMLLEERRQAETQRRREELASELARENQGKPSPAAQQVTAADVVKLDDPFLAPCEKELLGFIVENGRTPLEFDRDSEYFIPDDRPDTVAEFIDNALAADDVSFSNSAYRKVYEYYFELYDQGLTQTQIQTRLMNSQDPDIAAVAADLHIDKYLLTVENYRRSLTSVATQLIIFVPKSLLAYQSKRLDKMSRELSGSLAAAAGPDEQNRILEKMNALNKARTVINRKLGRV